MFSKNYIQAKNALVWNQLHVLTSWLVDFHGVFLELSSNAIT